MTMDEWLDCECCGRPVIGAFCGIPVLCLQCEAEIERLAEYELDGGTVG